MKYYRFNQNNSGGNFVIDDDVTTNVFIQAPDANAANRRAREIGIYFDGCESGQDCSCCGDRWLLANSYDAHDLDEIFEQYGVNNQTGDPSFSKDHWVEPGQPYCHVYYEDGRKDSFIRTRPRRE